ncbi:Probable prolyl 4-hydroxylase 11 [Striga hermonthica]|uniref:Probable prolyl 4-hydroxylase 11 n=1 Tax=Striga hermonthica TaxID=68872 RepID=A0A9N7N552_STRHE|nr:Probable prolyl 4-hydroxylase 11 [Striga hermonthica]
MTGGSKFEVSKFNGHGNFGLWQTKVKDLLAQQGILKGLRAGKPKGMEDDDWQDLQERAAGTIRLCLADEVMYHQRLYGLKMQERTDLGQHVNIFNQVVTDLASLEVKFEDEDKAMILLCSLPPSYEHMVTTLTYGKKTIKTEEITSALLAHNQRKQKSGESSSQSDSLYVKGNQDRGRKHGRDNSGNRNFRSKSRDKSQGRKTVTCYKCKEQGHFKRDCPKWKKQTADMSSKSANVVQNEESDCSDGDMLSISTAQYDDAWILDSGCSYHITPNREWFATYKPGNSGSVFLGDDRCCGIVGIGDVKIKINGFIPKADEDRETIKIVKGALTVMKGRITAGNIYKLLGSTVVGGVHSV